MRFLLLTTLLFTATIAQAQTLRMGVGSCNDQRRPQDFWTHIQAADPNLFLYVGDNVYADRRDPDTGRFTGKPDWVREAYAQLGAQEQFTRFAAQVPIYPVWDDHDYGINDAGVELAFKQESREALLDFFDFPQEPQVRGHEGVYYAVEQSVGDIKVQILMLDTRWNRSPLTRVERRLEGRRGAYMDDPSPEATILGAAQWQWLEVQLRKPADVRLLVSSIQVLADSHHYERWGNFPAERQRLFDLIQETQAEGVIFVSGDRHLSGFYRNTDAGAYPLYELTSSSLNRGGRADAPNEDGPYQILSTYRGVNFSLIDINADTRTVQMTINRSEDGKQVRALQIPLSLLRRY